MIKDQQLRIKTKESEETLGKHVESRDNTTIIEFLENEMEMKEFPEDVTVRQQNFLGPDCLCQVLNRN